MDTGVHQLSLVVLLSPSSMLSVLASELEWVERGLALKRGGIACAVADHAEIDTDEDSLSCDVAVSIIIGVAVVNEAEKADAARG